MSAGHAGKRLKRSARTRCEMTGLKIGDEVLINPHAVVLPHRDEYVAVGYWASGTILEIEDNDVDGVIEAKIRLRETERSYWFYLNDLALKQAK